MDQKKEKKILTMLKVMDERQKRLFLASEASDMGRGGISELSRLTGVSRTTITAGMKEYEELQEKESDELTNNERTRKTGGGRKLIEEVNSEVEKALLQLVDKDTYGNPQNPLCWTIKSTRNLSEELTKQGHTISHTSVGRLLVKNGFTLQENRKLNQVGKGHPDRNKQFEYINNKSKSFMEKGLPVISVDCKKKEPVGNFKNAGADWHEKGTPTKVNDHDWAKDHAAPYGVYDPMANTGFVNVGISSDTAEFAVHSIREWWVQMGKSTYPNAKELYITCDGGGSNGRRNRLWKLEIHKFAKEYNLIVHISHFPPGASKWNKIEHRLFSQISRNWKERPLETYETVVSLIGATTAKSRTGGPDLTVSAQLDDKIYSTGIKVPKEIIDNLDIVRDEFHGEWNYTVYPKQDLVDLVAETEKTTEDKGKNTEKENTNK